MAAALSQKLTAEQIDECLMALIVAGGNSNQAARELAKHWIEINPRTLRNWPEVHADRYQALVARHEDYLAEKCRRVIDRATDVTLLALDKHEEDLNAGKVKDTAGAARNVATVGGIYTTKLMEITGRPTVVHEHRNPQQAIRELARLVGKEHILDVQAEDITDRKEIERADE